MKNKEQKEKIYTVEWIDYENATVCISKGRESVELSIDDVEFIGFNKLWAVIKNK